MTLGVRAIVEDADGRVLLVRHTYVKGWHLPGGGVERGEPCLEALRRELIEEGGVILRNNARLTGVYSNHASFRNDHVLVYHVPADSWDPGTPTAWGEIAEISWFTMEDLPDTTTQGTRQRLAEFGGAPVKVHWASIPS